MGALPVAGWFRNTRGLGVDPTVAVHRSSEQSHCGTEVRTSTLSPAGGYAEVQATFLSGKGPIYLARPQWPSEQTFKLGALISGLAPSGAQFLSVCRSATSRATSGPPSRAALAARVDEGYGGRRPARRRMS